MIGVQSVIADIPGRDPENGYAGRFGDFPFETVKVCIDALGLPAGIGEDRVIDFRENSFCGEGEQGTGLDTGPKRKGAELRRGGNGRSLD